MRTILAIIGALALIVIVLFVGFIFVGVQKIAPLMEESVAFADESMPAITKEWDGEELWARAAPELRELLGNGGLEQLMSTGSYQIGNLVEHGGAECTLTHFEFNTGNGELALAQCTGKSRFEKAIAGYRLDIVKRKGEWKILGFFITPEEKVEQPVTVSHTMKRSAPTKKLEISLDKFSIGVSSGTSFDAGADIAIGTKIENAE